MATALSIGDVAIVHYDTTTGTFTFAFLRDVEAGTEVKFTDNGWLASGGFRPGEGTVTYTAPAAVAAGTIVTLTGLALDPAGDQIIAYQGDPATPTILYLVDFGDGNNTVAGDATDANTTALPPGFTLGVNAVALAFDNSLYAGPIGSSPELLLAAVNNSANWLESNSLPVAFVYDARPSVDLDSDNSSGAFNFDYLTLVTSGGPAVPISDFDVDIDDFDDFDLLAAEFRLISADAGDLLAVSGSLPFGIVAQAYNPLTGVLRLEGLGTHDDYEAAIRQVVFSTLDAPGTRNFIQVSVYDGWSWSVNTTSIIRVANGPIAVPPQLDLDANNSTGFGVDASATYAAGREAVPVTDTDVLITDDGTTIQSAKINILDYSLHNGDTLSIAGALPTGITASSYNPFTGIITLSGSASLADYQTALRQVVFSSTLAFPSTQNRDIQVSVDDGRFESNFATMHMHVVIPPPNDAPVLDLDFNNSTTSGTNYLTGFTESVPPVPVAIVDADVRISDSDDFNLASATITLTNPQAGDHLTFIGTPPPGILVFGTGTSLITLTGVASQGNYELALRQIRYSNDSVDPSNVTRTIEIVVNDGIDNSNTATALVQVEAVNNSAPVLDLDPNDSSASTRSTFRTIFTENGAPTPIADTDTTITDLDSTTIASATITLVNQTSFDFLSATLPLPGGIVASAYDPLTGVLTLTGVATLDEYEVALQQVHYNNDNDNPDTKDRLIEVVVSDGVNTSNVAATVITVVTANDAPEVVLEGTVYLEDGPIVTLDPIAAFSDPDDTEFSQVTVRISTGGQFDDRLTIGGLTGGVVNGITFIFEGGDLTMVLTGASSILNYQDLLRTLEFQSPSDNPTNFGADAVRILTWTVSDGEANTITTTTLDIQAVNDAPQATVAATASYTENAAPVVLSPASTVTDVDDLILISGEVRIVSGALNGDLLTVNGLQSGTFSGINFSYDAALHDLRFTGPTTVADYQAFLQAVAFSSTSDNPTNFGLDPTRTLSWSVDDGRAISAVQTTVVSITALADAPVNTVPGAQVVNEDTLLPIAGVSVADADSSTLTTTLTVTNGIVNVTTGAGVTGNGTATVTITGTAAEINTALAGLTYTGNLDFNGLDTLTVTTGDGTAQDIDTIAITVNPVNDAPVNTVPGAQIVNEDAALPIAGVSVADVDGGALTTTLAVTNGTLNVTAGAGVTGNGTATVIITGTVAEINTALGGLTYTGNLNFNGSDTLTVTTGDGTAQDIDTVAITVNPVNDTPVNTVPGAQSVNEDATLPIAGVSVADVDGGALTTTLTVTNGIVNVTPGAGVTGNGTTTVTISGTAAEINAAVAGLAYTGNLNFNGSDTLTVTTGDGTAQDIDTVAITVNPVSDAPVNTVPGAQSVNEDTLLSIGGVTIADVDGGALTTTLSVTSGTLNVTTGAGVTGNGTATVTITGTVADINTALAGLTYIGNLNFNGSDTLTVTTGDGTAQDIDTVAITVNPVNDAPVNTVPGAQSVNEDVLLPIAGVSVADVDGTPLTTTLTVTSGTLSVTTGGGATIGGNGSAAVTLSGSAAQINAALAGLAYTGNLNFNGSDTLTVTTGDGTAQDVDTIAITVNPLNDAPVNTVPGPQSVNEDTALPIADVSVADADGSPLTTTLTVTSGTLSVTTGGGATIGGNGSAAVTLSGSATQINAALAGLSYTGNLNFNGSDTLTVTTGDGTAQDIDTVAITVSPVNDAPVNTVPGPQTAQEDTPLLIAGLSVADVDSPTLTVTVSALNGSVAIVPGLALIAGNLTATATITGTLAEVNLALAGVHYLGNPNFAGSDTLTVTTSDGALSNIDPVAITVAAIADAPVLDLDADNSSGAPGSGYITTFTENGSSVALTDADLVLDDVDSPNLVGATFVLLNAQAGDALVVTGSLPTGISAVVTGNQLTLSGSASVADYKAALQLIAFNNPGDAPDPQDRLIQVTVNDGTKTTSAFTLVHLAVTNDAPVNTVPGAQSVAEDTLLPIPGVSVADAENAPLTTTLMVTSGTLSVATGGGATIGGNGTAIVTLSGSATQINAALAGLSYTGNLDFNGPDTLTVTTGDGTVQDIDTVAITVNPVNDAPVNTVPGAQTVNEDATLPITGVSVADVDGPALTTTLAVSSGTLNVTTGGGATIGGNGSAIVTLSGSAAQINAALVGLAYTGTLNFNGSDTLSVITGDGTAQDVDTVAITVNPLNDAPVNTVPGPQSVNEDVLLPITGVSVADADGTPLTTTLTVSSGKLSVATGGGATIGGNGSAAVTLSGSDAQINAALAGLSYTGNLNFNGSDTLTVTTGDGTAQDVDTVAITVNPVNDAPVNTVPGPQSVNEDTLLPIPGVSVADVDSASLTTTLTVTSGTLNVTTGGGATIGGNGTAAVTLSGSAAQINAALAGLAYTGNLNFNGSDTLTVTTSDGTAQDVDTIAITVNPLNDAPVNTVPGAQTVNEDVLLPITGVLVADADGSALTTTLTVTSGTLSVTLGGGATIGGNGSAAVTLSGSAAQINAALAGLSYTGNLNFNGSDTLTVTTGDGTAQDVDTVAITVSPVNDAPVNTVPGPQTAQEDTPLLIPGLSVADVDSPSLTVTVSALNGSLAIVPGLALLAGNLSNSVTISGTLAEVNLALASVYYLGNPNFFGADTLTVTTSDGTAQDVDTVAITVNAVNDAPVLDLDADNSSGAPGSGYVTTFTENGSPVALTATDLLLTDVDSPNLAGATFRLLNAQAGDVLLVTGSLPTGISAVVTGNQLTLSGSALVADYRAALQLIAFNNPGDAPAPQDRLIQVTVNDGTKTTSAFTLVHLAVTNDAPVNTVPGPQSVNEDATLPIAGVSVADADSPALTTTLAVTSGTLNVATGGGATIGGNGTAAVTLSGSAAQINAALVGLAYTGNLNFNGPDTLTVTTGDGTAQDIDTVAITVNPVNDVPVNTVPGSQSVAEDTLLPIPGVSVADADGGALTTTLVVTNGILNVTPGAGVTGNGTATVTIAGTAAQINAALAGLSYTGNPDFNGSDTLTVTTSDGTAQDVDPIVITVNPVADAPVNTVPAAQSVNEDTLLAIAGVSVADADGGALSTTLTVTSGILNVTPGAGVSGNGTAVVNITGTAAEINAALAGLSYTGTLNFHGSDTLTVTTSDGTATDTDTVAITVNPLNDAPVNTVPGAQTVNEDTALSITGVSVADVDGSPLTTTLTVTSGTLNVTAGGGATIGGNGSAAVTLSGSAAQINAALAGLSYTGNSNFNGSDTLTVSTGDGTATDTDTVAITVNPLNDAPVNTVPGAQTVNEDTALSIAGVSVADADSPALTTTLTVTSGTLNVTAGGGATIGGNGSAAVTLSGSAAQINAALAGLSYTGNLNFNGSDTLTVSTGDGTATDTDTVAITVSPVNDPPVNTVPAAQTVNEDTALPIPGVSVADVENAPLTTTLTVTSGKLSVATGGGATIGGNGSAAVTLSGSATQINAALAGLSYTGNPNFNGSDTLTVATTDDGPATDTDTVVITVSPVNDAPVNTVPGAQTVNEDTALPIPGVSVADVDGLPLTTTLTVTRGTLSVTTGGGATIGGNGSATVTLSGSAAQINAALAGLSYTGTLNFNGSDTLTVTTSDGTAQDTDTVAITVSPVNDPPVNTVPGPQSVNEDTLLPIPGVSVADVDGPPLTTTLTVSSGTLSVATGGGVTIGGNGTAAVTLSGSATDVNAALAGLSYTGNLNFNGSDTLTVTTGDVPAQDIDTVAIIVNPVNDAPVNTVPGAQTVNEDTPLSIAGVSVADVDGSPLTTTLTVTSGKLNVATGGGATILDNGTAAVTLSGSAAQINAALAGLSYTGNLDFNGLDTLTVTTGDGVAQDVDTVTITVNPVNDAPVNTVPGPQSAVEDTPLLITGLSVADDSPTLTVTLSVLNGSVAIVPGLALLAGNLTGTATITGTLAEVNLALANVYYLGNPNFFGSDTLTVTTSDGALSDIDFVQITVADTIEAPDLDLDASTPGTGYVTTFTENGLPVALTDTDLVLADDSSTLASAIFLLLNAQAGDALVVTGPLPGGISPVITGNQITLTGPASVTDYTAAMKLIAFTNPGDAPDPQDRLIQVTVNDGTSTTSAFTLVHMAVTNDAPVAQDGSAIGNEDTPINGTVVAIDPDGPTLTYALGIQAANGTVVVNPGGTYIYTPNPDYNGGDSFTFTVNDGAGGSDTATITLTINAVNDAPVAQDGSNSGNEDTPISGTVAATDVDGLTLTYALGVQAVNGTVVVNAAGSYTYTPKPNFNGSDSFTYTASDGAGGSDTATVTLTVNPVNDAPVAQFGDGGVDEDTPLFGALVATDVDGQAVTYALATQSLHGTVVVNPDGTASYTPDPDFNGSDSFTYTASDGAAGSNIATVTLTVNPVNDAPVNTVPGPQTTVPDTDTPIGGFAVGDVDAGGGTLTATLSVAHGTLVVIPAGGAAVAGNGTSTVVVTGTLPAINTTLAATGSVVYRAAAGFFGTDMLIVTTEDGGNTGSGGALSDTDTVAISVGGNAPAGIVLSNTTINEFSQDGTLVGSLAAIGPDPGDTFTFALLDDAGARFAIDGTSLVVNHGLLLDFEQAAAHAITVEVTDGSGLSFQQSFSIGVLNVDPEIITQSSGLGGSGPPGGITIVGGPLDDRIGLAGGDDTIDAGAGNDFVDGGLGNDHLTGADGDDMTAFTAPLGSTAPDDFGQWIDIAGADGSDRLFTIEHLQFPDGTVHVNDGDRLFDTLFYDHQNPDVFHAAAHAGEHYAVFGWHEGRDPNAFLSTNQYLAAYGNLYTPPPVPPPVPPVPPPVPDSGGSPGGAPPVDPGSTPGSPVFENPLEHYREPGWRAGFDPSLLFDTTLYLVHNPDVAAAGINPLEHFLQNGRAEGRAAYPSIGQNIGMWGFDAEFYLMSNLDVAAAGFDPLEHYKIFGWHEGRNPNRYFDTAGYLAHNTDVAAAGINPLQHYDQFGWREGRDPSGAFDTLNYLSANPDVAAAGVNPLTHFLQFGIYEVRDPFADGIWR